LDLTAKAEKETGSGVLHSGGPGSNQKVLAGWTKWKLIRELLEKVDNQDVVSDGRAANIGAKIHSAQKTNNEREIWEERKGEPDKNRICFPEIERMKRVEINAHKKMVNGRRLPAGQESTQRSSQR